MHAHKHSLVALFDRHVAERIFGEKLSALFLISDHPKPEHLKVIKEYAQRHSSQLIFGHSPITSDPGDKLAEFFSIIAEDDPTVAIIDFQGNQHLTYRLESSEMNTLANFIEQYFQKTLTPFYKSQLVPELDDSHIKTIVGKTFDEMVLKSNNFVLLSVYAPWCQHSKDLAPVYVELAYKLREVEDLTIAEIDGTANEHPALKIEGFPSLLFFRRDDKSHPVEYKGGRNIKELISFLEEELGRDFSESEEIPLDSGL